MDPTDRAPSQPFAVSLSWIPFFNVMRLLQLLLTFGAGIEVLSFGSEISSLLLKLFLVGTSTLSLGIYLHAVLPDTTGHAEPVCFCVSACFKSSGAKQRKVTNDPEDNHGTYLLAPHTDADVLEESDRVFHDRPNTNGPETIRMFNLAKNYNSASLSEACGCANRDQSDHKAAPQLAVNGVSQLLLSLSFFGYQI